LTIIIDGKLDDGPWVKIPGSSTGHLRELQTGRLPTFATSFKAEWIGQNLYFAIRCEERPGEQLNIATEKNGDQAIWYGDCIEIELATDAHNYYQIAINPAGALVDIDRGAPRNQWFNWSSKAEVATHTADDHWTVEVRLPITQDENDPLHQIIGRKPTKSLPWFVNVCRQRVRDNGTELSAFSPTGSKSFHAPMKFAHFFAGNSHRFESDSSVTDHIIGSRIAEQLARSRKWDQALTGYLELSTADKISDLRKADALHQAARCAAGLKDYERADDLAALIPIDSVRKTVLMQNLSAQRKWKDVADQFGDEDLTEWPFWQIGEAAFARGKGHYFIKAAEKAEADLGLALEYEPDKRVQQAIRAMLAQNREANLDDIAGALNLYRANIEGKKRIGGADEFRSVDRVATILSKQGKHEEALATFAMIDFNKTKGFWHHEMLLSKANVLAAAGKSDQARELANRVARDKSTSGSQRKRAAQFLETE